ncbi:retrovirus-related pol polyprotein from transposon TNT 1-94 [Tanacetum coccineum]
MRMAIANNIKSTLPGIEKQNAKDFLKLVEEKFRSADKQHVLDMTNTAARLKTLGVDKKLKPKAKNFKKKQHGTTSKVANAEKKEQMDNKCKFCRKKGHFQNDCPKRKAWFEKKGIHYVSVCFELNLFEVPSNTWWFAHGATTHHKHLGHISKDILQRLVKNKILPNLDFTDFGLCVECIKAKQTKRSKKGATRSSDLLEIIHTDICGPFDTPSFTGQKYVITLIDDFSRYWYVYLLHEKSQPINALEVCLNEVKRQLDRKVKIIVRSDKGGEYYGKYDETGQCPGPFAKFLKSRGICAQYTMPGTPQQNGVLERQNKTLMEMIRSMISKSSLPKSLWIYALRTAVYLLNRVPSKLVKKTDFDLWTGRRPSLRRLHVWGCLTEVRVYNPQEKKLDSRTVSGYFIGYPEKSKGYRFYCPNHSSRIIETSNAKFLEKGEVSVSVENQVVDINEIRDDDPSPMNVHKSTTTPNVLHVFQNQEQYLNNEQTPHEETNLPTQTSEPVRITLNKPVRVRNRKSDKSEIWIDAMKEDLKSMAENRVFKTKRDSKGNVERYKSRLVDIGYTQKNGVDYNETFSPVSKKDSLRIILALVTYFNLDLHQMDVKTAFQNGNLKKEVYMEQPEGFFIDGYLSKNFEMKDMGEASYVIGILIFRDVSKGLLGLSQKAYIDKFLRDSSIMESEFVACYEATIHALWLWNFISGLGVVDTISKPLKMYYDNTATIFFYKNDNCTELHMGRIPKGPHFSTFGTSFGGNSGLYGSPLPKREHQRSPQVEDNGEYDDGEESGFTWKVTELSLEEEEKTQIYREMILLKVEDFWVELESYDLCSHYVYAPTVYRNLSTTKLLTMEFVQGAEVNDLKSIQKLGISPHDIARLVGSFSLYYKLASCSSFLLGANFNFMSYAVYWKKKTTTGSAALWSIWIQEEENHNLVSSYNEACTGTQVPIAVPGMVLNATTPRVTLSVSISVAEATRLNGTLPSWLFTSPSYKSLSNSNNIGNVPFESFALPSLQELSLRYNQFDGDIPSDILINLTHLTYFDLSDNNLNGTLPSWLFTSPSLQYLSLLNNMFSGNVPFESFALPSLQELYLSNNQLRGQIDMQTFRQLTNLTDLHLSSNNFSGELELDTFLSSLANLEYLDLSYSGFSVTTNNANHYVNPGFIELYLASCKLKVFPNSFRAK